jgi:heme A synthase
MKGYPKWFTAKLITGFCLVSFVTGLSLFPTFLNLKMEWDMPWTLQADQRTWVIAGHVLFGFISFMILGALFSLHMRLGWRKKTKVKSGIALVVLTFILGLTGISVLYMGNEQLSNASSITHFFAGLTLTSVYFLHLFLKGKK